MSSNTFNLSEILAADPVEVLKRDGDMIAAMSDLARDNKDLALIALESSATAYICLSHRLKGDPDIYRLAVANNGSMYNYLPRHLLGEEGLLSSALRTCPRALDHAVSEGIVNYMWNDNLGFLGGTDNFFAAVHASQYSHILYIKMSTICEAAVSSYPELLISIYRENPELADRTAKVLGMEHIDYKSINLKSARQ
jgi:hypothetical protein